MDYGSLYGMGSYFGQDYTALALMRLAALTEDNLAAERASASRSTPCQPISRRRCATPMRAELQRVDLTQHEVADPGRTGRARSSRCAARSRRTSRNVDLVTGWTPAYSLDQNEAAADRRLPDLLRAHHRRAAART